MHCAPVKDSWNLPIYILRKFHKKEKKKGLHNSKCSLIHDIGILYTVTFTFRKKKVRKYMFKRKCPSNCKTTWSVKTNLIFVYIARKHFKTPMYSVYYFLLCVLSKYHDSYPTNEAVGCYCAEEQSCHRGVLTLMPLCYSLRCRTKARQHWVRPSICF